MLMEEDPTMLRQLDSNLWVLDKPFRIMGLDIGGRMTVVKLPSGGLWVHSPVRTTPAERAALDRLGPVRHIVAPNLVHHLFVPELKSCYPEAQLHIAPGLEKKNPRLQSGLFLGDNPPAAWSQTLQQIFVPGMPGLNETVFLCGRTLIATDLAFNIKSSTRLGTRMFLWLDQALGGVRATRIIRAYIKERAQVHAAMKRILAWDFDRLIVAHGEVLDQGAQAALRDAYRFLET